MWRVCQLGRSTAAVAIPKALRELYSVEIGDVLPVEMQDGRLIIDLAGAKSAKRSRMWGVWRREC